MRAVPPVPASRCDARRAITFEREMRGLRPFSERAGASFAGVASVGAGRFLAGVGMPECIPNVSGVLKIPPGRGENVPWGVEGGRGEVTAGLFVISPSVGPGDWYPRLALRYRRRPTRRGCRRGAVRLRQRAGRRRKEPRCDGQAGPRPDRRLTGGDGRPARELLRTHAANGVRGRQPGRLPRAHGRHVSRARPRQFARRRAYMRAGPGQEAAAARTARSGAQDAVPAAAGSVEIRQRRA